MCFLKEISWNLEYIIFSYSRLNSNISKCETAGIGAVKMFHMAAYGLKSIDLTSDTLKILGVPFPVIKNFRMKKTSAM